MSLVMGELMKQELSPIKDAAKYLRVAFTSTLFAGVFQASLGILRLGFVTEYLSHAVIVGFMAGAAITISLQQLRGLFNIKPASFSKKTNLVAILKSVFHNHDQAKKKPKFFWIAVVAPLLSIVISTASVYATRIDKQGVLVAGYIEKGVNPSSADGIFLSGPFIGTTFKIGFIASLIAMIEGLAIGRTFAKLRRHRLDGNNEMVAFGFMNICGSLLSYFVTFGSFSRSALSYATGGLIPMANIMMATLVAITLSVLTPLIHYTPICILSVVIIAAVLTIIDFRAAYLIWKVDTLDFLTCLGSFFGTLFVSVEIGLLIVVSPPKPTQYDDS